MEGGAAVAAGFSDFRVLTIGWTMHTPDTRQILVTVLTVLCQFTQQQQLQLLGRRRGVVVSGVRRMNEVNARRARLVLGWVTFFGRVYHLSI